MLSGSFKRKDNVCSAIRPGLLSEDEVIAARKLTRQEMASWRAGSFQKPIARCCRPRCWSANIDSIQLISRRNLLLGEFRSLVLEIRV